jgi:hypothetical protein
MKIAEQITANRWLFAGLSALPSALQAAMLFCLFTFGHHQRSAPPVVPEWMTYGAFAVLPVLTAVVGFILAYLLSVNPEWLRWPKKSRLARLYSIVFVLLWNFVYGFLGLFLFAMGFGDGPEPTSIEQFGQRFIGVLSGGFPFATLISLIVCFLVTAAVIALGETILSGLQTTE